MSEVQYMTRSAHGVFMTFHVQTYRTGVEAIREGSLP